MEAVEDTTLHAMAQKQQETDDLPARPWITGFWRRFPWLSILTLLAALGCGFGALAVAILSQDQPVHSMKLFSYGFQPTVLISILVTLANTLLRIAFAYGIAISWWTNATHGAAVRKLHTLYEYGQGFPGAIVKCRPQLNSATVASLLMLLLLMDGPVLQRSITVGTAHRIHVENSVAYLSSLPLDAGSTAEVFSGLGEWKYTPAFATILRDYTARRPIQAEAFNCTGTCTTTVTAPGWDLACRTGTVPFQMESFENWSACIQNETACDRSINGAQLAFSTEFTLDEEISFDQEKDSWIPRSFTIVMRNVRKTASGPKGDSRWRECTLQEALVKYPLRISNNSISLVPESLSENRTESLVLRNSSTVGMIGERSSTFGGLVQAIKDTYTTKAEMSVVTGPQYYVAAINNSRSIMYMEGAEGAATWSDPTDDILFMLAELTFRTGLARTTGALDPENSTARTNTFDPNRNYNMGISSPDVRNLSNTSQPIALIMESDETVYRMNPSWLAAGVSIICKVCLGICPLFWGWWYLGRDVSMNPLEISEAFEAPLLKTASSNLTAEQLVKSLNGLSVRYQEVRTGLATGDMIVADETYSLVDSEHPEEAMALKGRRHFRQF